MRGFGTVQFKKIGKQLIAFFLVLALLIGSGVMAERSRFDFFKIKKASAQEVTDEFQVMYQGFLYVPPIVYDFRGRPYAVDHVTVIVWISNAASGSWVVFGGFTPQFVDSSGYAEIRHDFRTGVYAFDLFHYPIYIYVRVPCGTTTRWGVSWSLYTAPGGQEWSGGCLTLSNCRPFFYYGPNGLPQCTFDENCLSVPRGWAYREAEPGLKADYLRTQPWGRVPSSGIEGGAGSCPGNYAGNQMTGTACTSPPPPPPPPPPSPFDLKFLGDLFANAFSLQSSSDKISAPNIVATSGAAPSFGAIKIGNYTPNIDTQGRINAILTRLGKYKITKNSVSEAINYLNSNTTTQPPEGWIIFVSGSGVETLTRTTITSGAKGTIILPSGKTLNITGNISYADDTASLAIVALDNSDPAIKVASGVASLRGAYITLGAIQLPDKPIEVKGLLVGQNIKLPSSGQSSTFTYDHNLTENPPPGLREILHAIFKETAP